MNQSVWDFDHVSENNSETRSVNDLRHWSIGWSNCLDGVASRQSLFVQKTLAM